MLLGKQLDLIVSTVIESALLAAVALDPTVILTQAQSRPTVCVGSLVDGRGRDRRVLSDESPPGSRPFLSLAALL